MFIAFCGDWKNMIEYFSEDVVIRSEIGRYLHFLITFLVMHILIKIIEDQQSDHFIFHFHSCHCNKSVIYFLKFLVALLHNINHVLGPVLMSFLVMHFFNLW